MDRDEHGDARLLDRYPVDNTVPDITCRGGKLTVLIVATREFSGREAASWDTIVRRFDRVTRDSMKFSTEFQVPLNIRSFLSYVASNLLRGEGYYRRDIREPSSSVRAPSDFNNDPGE